MLWVNRSLSSNPIIIMTNLNVIGWVERFKLKNQSERPFYQDEHQFYLFHPPMSTENGKQLQEFFDERTEIENEKFRLKEEERKLVDKFDDLNRTLQEIQKKPAATPEEEEKKEEEMSSIREQIQKVAEELMKVKEKIEEKELEIDRVNEKINEMTEIVIEDEHKLVQEQQEIEKENNDKKVELLMNKLAA